MSSYKKMAVLYNLFLKKKWDKMRKFYLSNDMTISLPHTVFKDTAIHVAVYSENQELVETLLKIVYKEDLEQYFLGEAAIFQKQNTFGNTPLHEAASIGNVEMVKIVMQYDPELLKTKNRRLETPFFMAAVYGKTNVIKYLVKEFKKDVKEHADDENLKQLYSYHTRSDTSSVLHEAIRGYYFETALELVKEEFHIQKDWKDANGMTCFQLLANIPSAFKSGYSFGILEKLIYLCLPKDDYRKDMAEKNNLSQVPRSPKTDVESGLPEDHGNTFFEEIAAKIYISIWRKIAKGFPSIKDLWDTKTKHSIVVELSKYLAGKDESWLVNKTDGQNKEITDDDQNKEITDDGQNKQITDGQYDSPLIAAARNGIIEIVKAIFDVSPQAIEHENHRKENIFHVAVERRRKNVLQYLLQYCHISDSRLMWKINEHGDSILHKAAYKSEYSSRGRPGEALRLQSDIQWFQQVKKMVPPHHINHLNKKKLTPQALFKEEHNELVKNGQEWLIRTTNSCIIVAVLIATVAFTSIYTVPGGSHPKTGKPLLLNTTAFTVFTASDVASLCFAFTAVVVFLSITTSKMNEQDFRRSLPMKFVLGLSMLFWSVAALMVGFAATLVITISHKHQAVAAPIITIACFPVAFFLLLQLPLYFNITWFTIKDLLRTLIDNFIPHHKTKSQLLLHIMR